MLPLTLEQIQSAQDRLKTLIHYTRVVTSQSFDAQAGCSVYFKAEHEQKTGSFKVRGAFTKVLGLDLTQTRGVITHSSGNHGQALAYVARTLGIPAVVVMPRGSTPIKIQAVQQYGAEVLFCANTTTAREQLALALAEEQGLTIVPPYDDWQVIRGQGTLGLEFLAQVPTLDALVIPVGGGGLISGMALAAKQINPKIQIWGVETAAAQDAYRSFYAQERLTIDPPITLADGIRSQTLGERPWQVIRTHIEGMALVSEAELIETLLFLVTRLKVWIEPTAAVAAAALFFQKIPGLQGKNVGTLLCGGNADPQIMADVLCCVQAQLDLRSAHSDPPSTVG